MSWKFDSKTPGICHLLDWSDVFRMPYFYACIRAFHDDAEVWTFTQRNDRNFANHIKISFVKYPLDPDPLGSAGYQLPCHGDSGGRPLDARRMGLNCLRNKETSVNWGNCFRIYAMWKSALYGKDKQ